MATIEFSFDGRDPGDMVESFSRLPDELHAQLEDAAEDIGQRIRGDAADKAPVDTGQLAASIQSVVDSVAGSLIEIKIGSNRDGAAAQEFGLDAGEVFPPPSELRDWARRVLGDADLAYPVARSIHETGIEEQRYLRDAIDENVEWALDQINQAVEAAFEAAGFDP